MSQLLGLGLSTIGKYVDDMTTWQGQGAQISHYHYVVLDEEVIVLICFDWSPIFFNIQAGTADHFYSEKIVNFYGIGIGNTFSNFQSSSLTLKYLIVPNQSVHMKFM